MTALETLILGIVQGLTEFLPVSSSGHLELVKFIFGSDYEQDQGLLLTITLHAATAISTIFVFRKDIGTLLADLLQFKKGESLSFSLKILLSMVPAVLVGLLYEDFIASLFDGKIALVGSMLLVTALLLFFADRVRENYKSISFPNAFSIGIIQAIAILPGISRSGATIALAVLLNLDRNKAAKFSFLMVIPLILGSMAKSILDGDLSGETTPVLPLIVGFVSAFLSGVLACQWMVALVKKSQLKFFGYYCMVVGLIAILLSL
jgi:undecaprenyl-diphosphatase